MEARMEQLRDQLPAKDYSRNVPWDPNATDFPTFHELPPIEGAPEHAAWFWGEDDNLGRINLLTPARVAAAAKEIRTGDIIPVNLPLHVPNPPGMGRDRFEHHIKELAPGMAYDDQYVLNTQAGTQWDGFRHFCHIGTKQFYNGATGADIIGEQANDKISIHHWAEHGIAGRGILLDYRSYAQRNGIEYSPVEFHEISYAALYACGKEQGVDIRPAAQGGDIEIGDMLFVRSGWKEDYESKTQEEHEAVAYRKGGVGPDQETRFAGLKQEDAVREWLHNCYFATAAGDSPVFEAWPKQGDWFLHEHLLALWGMPLGEMLDLEALAAKCREQGRWFFFFTSAPANCVNGVASLVNGTAIL